MRKCGRHFQYGTDLMYGIAPAALGICEFTHMGDDVPNSNWSLRVFNDFNSGFKAHFPVGPSCLHPTGVCVVPRMAFNVIPTWVPGKFEKGFSFSTKVRARQSERRQESSCGKWRRSTFEWVALLPPVI